MRPKYSQQPHSSWQLVVFLASIFNPWIVLHVQTQWWPRVKPHSEDAPEDNRPSTFSSISCKETIPPDLFHFMTHSPPSILKLSFMIIFSVCPPPLCSSCILFSGGADYKLLVMQSPHCALQCHDASCLSRELWSLSQKHIVILEVACVCLSEARVSWSSSATPLALVCKGAMTDGDPSSRHVNPPSAALSTHSGSYL